jgi:poly-gamma-glutamate synthesis protein (capsule biosynthesis protein)
MASFNQQGLIYPASFFPGYFFNRHRYNTMAEMEVPAGAGRAVTAAVGRDTHDILFLGEFQPPATIPAITPELRALIRQAKAIVLNLEAPLCARRCEPVKTPLFPSFQMTPATFRSILEAYSISPSKCIVNLANNHAYDLGPRSLARTTRLLHEMGCRVIGTREHPSVIVKGIRIIGCTARMNPSTHEHADTLVQPDDVPIHDRIPTIVYVHWGWEYYDEPDEQTRALAAHWCRPQTNVVAVVGHGPHLLQRMRAINGRPVFYSLGDTTSQTDFHLGNPRSLSAFVSVSPSGYAITPVLAGSRIADTADSLRRFHAYYM